MRACRPPCVAWIVTAVVLRQLRQRFGDAMDAHVEQRITTASIEQIDLWTMRILSAATLAEVFVD